MKTEPERVEHEDDEHEDGHEHEQLAEGTRSGLVQHETLRSARP